MRSRDRRSRLKCIETADIRAARGGAHLLDEGIERTPETKKREVCIEYAILMPGSRLSRKMQCVTHNLLIRKGLRKDMQIRRKVVALGSAERAGDECTKSSDAGRVLIP
jgi:hypothetical protein